MCLIFTHCLPSECGQGDLSESCQSHATPRSVALLCLLLDETIEDDLSMTETAGVSEKELVLVK